MDELNEKIEGLVKKAEKSKMPYSILKKVYDRGMAAWRTGHRPGTTPQQWAFARVNSFITKSSGTWGKADKDLAKQVRGEEVEKRTTAKKMLGQVREKLPKDADAGDYVKDFRKSDAPQFKGKSDKKIQKMAIAAYLDDKDKKESIKENLLIHTKDDRVTDQLAYHLQDLQGRGRSNISDIDLDNVYNHHKNKYVKGRINVEIDGSRSDSQKLIKDLQKKYGSKIKVSLDMGEEVDMQEASEFEIQVFMLGKILQKHPKFTDEMYDNFMDYAMGGDDFGPALKKSVPRQLYNAIKSHLDKQLKVSQFLSMSNDIQESGHTDVASMKTQVQIAKDALEKMNMELGKLSDEEDLPTWWTNKVATAVGKLDGMADYIDAKSDQGQKMNESNLTEEKVFVVRFEKEGMRFAVPFSDMKRAKDGEKILKKSAGVSNVSVTKDILKPGVSMSKFRTRQEGKIVKESKMGELFLDMQMDAQEMSERDFIKTYSRQGFQAAELKRMHKEFNEEVDNSLMAQATRVISQTSIKEKIDPADIDMRATDSDRKAADKNIIIQLRRAQDMVKQTGRQDQTGVEFLDKKKQKIDSKIINKALDMFDKMKPNDKAKMQKTIGKSYRDLLKTVQRGRI